jgi:UTP-glucose-1-phosphate uridylyltransferase
MDDQAPEVQFIDTLEEMRSRETFLGLVIEGEKIDIGIPRGYLAGIALYSEATAGET